MSAFTPASEVLLRHCDDFASRHILFAGDLQDTLPAHFDCASRYVHTQQFHHWRMLKSALGDDVSYGLLAERLLADRLLADNGVVASVDTLIYYWPKSKSEALFQLQDLLSRLPVGCDVFVVGENRSGVRSAVTMLAEYCEVHKIDSARRCGLYHGQLSRQPVFALADYWRSYQVDQLTIKTLPGVFSQEKLDAGSQLLMSTFDAGMSGTILDMGCGCGVLAAVLASRNAKARLTLCDTSAAALAASEATFAANGLQARIVASDVFSEIEGKFTAIIANPPFHEGVQTNLHAARQLIQQAPNYLQPGGELRVVANGFLPYADWLDSAFGNHQVLARTSSFKVYQARLI